MCSLKQLCTQSGGLRPFGVSMLVAGIDEDGSKLFQTDPTGLFYQYLATVIGEGETDIQEVLHKEYKENMSVEQGLQIAVRAIKKFLGDAYTVQRLDGAFIDAKTKTMKKYSHEEISKIVNK